MSSIQTFDEFLGICLAVLSIQDHELNEPHDAKFKEGHYSITSTPFPPRPFIPIFCFGKYTDCFYGDCWAHNDWGKVCLLKIRSKFGLDKNFYFQRSNCSDPWSFCNSKSSWTYLDDFPTLKGIPEDLICPDVIQSMILKLFKFWYSKRKLMIPADWNQDDPFPHKGLKSPKQLVDDQVSKFWIKECEKKGKTLLDFYQETQKRVRETSLSYSVAIRDAVALRPHKELKKQLLNNKEFVSFLSSFQKECEKKGKMVPDRYQEAQKRVKETSLAHTFAIKDVEALHELLEDNTGAN